MQQKAQLTQGHVAKTLVRLTLPMFVAMFAMVGLNLIDTFYVGRLGTEQLAAMGFTLAAVMAVNSISMGLGVGTTAVISRVIGQGDSRGTQRLALHAMLLGVLVASTMAMIGLLSIDALFGLLGADGIVLEHVREYMTVWYLGVPIVVIPQVGNSAIRATGDTKTPAKIMLTVMTVNLILDPLFIFGLGPMPAFGLRGAAIATVIAQGVALVISSTVLYRRGLLVFTAHSLEKLWSSWRRILTIGVPAAITQMITPISTGVITSIVAGYGIAAVAGFGVVGRLEMFTVMAVMALGTALVPFVGQNWGAGHKDRVGEAVRVALIIAAGWGAFAWVISLLFGEPIAAVFNDNPQVIEVVTDYMRIVFPSLILLGALVTITNALNALHKPIHSMMLSVIRMFVLYVPFAFLGSALYGLTGVWWAAFASNVIGGLIAIVWFGRVFARMEPTPVQTNESAEEPASQPAAESLPA